MTNVTSVYLKWVFVCTLIKLKKFRKNREFLDQMSDSQPLHTKNRSSITEVNIYLLRHNSIVEIIHVSPRACETQGKLF
jgi:hypothetical protein